MRVTHEDMYSKSKQMPVDGFLLFDELVASFVSSFGIYINCGNFGQIPHPPD